MRKSIIDIYFVCYNEFKVVFKDPAVILLLVIVPFMYPLLYGWMYNNEVVRDVKTVVVDESNTTLSRQFARMVDGSGDVNVVAHVSDMEEAREAVRRKEAYGIIYIPQSFSKDLNTNKQATVVLYSEMSSMLFYKAMALTCTEVGMIMGANIRVNEVGHGTQQQDEAKTQLVDYDSVSFYNTPNGFGSFLVPAILIIVIQQTLVLGVGTIVGTHRDKRRFTVASHVDTGRDVNALSLTIGKAFCYSFIYIISSAWILRVIPYIFSLPQIGNPLVISTFILPYILAATFFAMTISYFVSQREFVMLLFVFSSPLFLFMSGISWPWIAIPGPLKAVAYLLPSTPGIHGFVKINTMGATLADVRFQFFMLWGQAIGYCILATVMYNWWINNYDPKFKGKNPSPK